MAKIEQKKIILCICTLWHCNLTWWCRMYHCTKPEHNHSRLWIIIKRSIFKWLVSSTPLWYSVANWGCQSLHFCWKIETLKLWFLIFLIISHKQNSNHYRVGNTALHNNMFDITLEIHIWRHCFDDLAVLTSLVKSSSSVSSLKIGCHPSLREYVVVPTSRLIDINDLWCLHSIMISAKNWQGGVAPVFFGENGFPDNSHFVPLLKISF